MSVFVVVGVVAVLMLVYMISVLGALPWFIYIPFILLFALVFFWDRIRAVLPGAKTPKRRLKPGSRNVKRTEHTSPKRGRRGRSGGNHSGKRI
ncbi:MAG: hypothetical protein ABR516_02950 [Desulfuromonadaceae bacterium]|nr:hypothetical protein [Geobacteraceae bacterium]